MSSACAVLINNVEAAVAIMDSNFRGAAHRLHLSSDLQTILATPYREVHMRIPVRMDDGKLRVFSAFSTQHNSVRGPSLGALRFAPGCDSETQRALAQLATWRCALINLPFGGSSFGIGCDPATLSRRELETVTRQFTARVSRLMGVYEDIISPDANTSAQVMDWVFDECSHAQDLAPGSVTGKSASIGGAIDFDEAEGLGLAVCTREVAARIKLDLRGARVIFLGFSRVACQAAEHLAKMGCKIVGLGDDGCALYSERGIGLDAMLAFKDRASAITELGIAQAIAPEDLNSNDCDILICAGAESALNRGNAARIRARMIVEAANFTSTPTADLVFDQYGITVVPDLLANAGAAIASYFEWEQNLEQKSVPKERMRERLESMMQEVTRTVVDRARQQKLSLRSAAYCIALERVARLESLRGV